MYFGCICVTFTKLSDTVDQEHIMNNFAPNALQRTRIYCTGDRNGKDGRRAWDRVDSVQSPELAKLEPLESQTDGSMSTCILR